MRPLVEVARCHFYDVLSFPAVSGKMFKAVVLECVIVCLSNLPNLPMRSFEPPHFGGNDVADVQL